MEIAFATQLLPWSLALGWYAWRWLAGTREDTAGRFLHAWWMAILAFFTLAAGKRSVYLLPLYPAVALLAARALATVLPRVRASRLALAIVVFDATVLIAVQAVRESAEQRESLVDFARQVAQLVPPEVPLRTAGLPPTDVWVLGYRLQRPIARARALRCHARAVYLVPARQAEGYSPLLVSSRRKGGDVALVRCEPGGRRRGRPASSSRAHRRQNSWFG